MNKTNIIYKWCLWVVVVGVTYRYISNEISKIK